MRQGTIGAALALLALAACGGPQEPRLLTLPPTGRGPDEFLVLPTKPLEAPADFAALPQPTPGGTNVTDPTPEADMIVALGGNPAATGGGAGVVGYAGRYGIDPGVRTELAAADLELRRRNDGRLLERIFNVNVYNRAYRRRGMELDQYRELERVRAAGIRTPAVPPVEATAAR